VRSYEPRYFNGKCSQSLAICFCNIKLFARISSRFTEPPSACRPKCNGFTPNNHYEVIRRAEGGRHMLTPGPPTILHSHRCIEGPYFTRRIDFRETNFFGLRRFDDHAFRGGTPAGFPTHSSYLRTESRPSFGRNSMDRPRVRISTGTHFQRGRDHAAERRLACTARQCSTAAVAARKTRGSITTDQPGRYEIVWRSPVAGCWSVSHWRH
jgi:hypothetical protein